MGATGRFADEADPPYPEKAFIIDLYLSQAASALAALTATRAIMACGFPLFSSQVRTCSDRSIFAEEP